MDVMTMQKKHFTRQQPSDSAWLSLLKGYRLYRNLLRNGSVLLFIIAALVSIHDMALADRMTPSNHAFYIALLAFILLCADAVVDKWISIPEALKDSAL
jgi:hypothetical protein